MKFLLLVLSISLLVACEPMSTPADGLDVVTDAAVGPDANPEASNDVLPPHVDGGGID